MLSFLSRVRHRGSNDEPQSHSASPPHASSPLETTTNLEDATPSPVFGQQIRPDLNSLPETYESEDISSSHQSKGSSTTLPPSSTQHGFSPLFPNPGISRNFLTKPPDVAPPSTPVSAGQPSSSIIAETSPLGGTFGRQQSPLANLSSVGSGSSHHRASSRSRSLGDVANIDQNLTNAQGSGWNQAPSNRLPVSGTFERSHSVRSLPDRKRRNNRRRRTNTGSLSSLRTNRSSSPATSRLNQTPSSVIHQSRSESPRTFGHPTPPYSTRTFGFHESPPPPLPPLDHPELRPTTPGGLYEPSSSTTTVFHVDSHPGTPQEPASGPSARRKPVARMRSKTFSVDSKRSSRRSSAEWSAVQATEGVLTNSNNWQTQVSREILRLSFGDRAASPGTEDPGNSRDVSHVPATRPAPAVAFVSPYPPPSPGSPLLPQGQENALYAAFLV